MGWNTRLVTKFVAVRPMLVLAISTVRPMLISSNETSVWPWFLPALAVGYRPLQFDKGF